MLCSLGAGQLAGRVCAVQVAQTPGRAWAGARLSLSGAAVVLPLGAARHRRCSWGAAGPWDLWREPSSILLHRCKEVNWAGMYMSASHL